ncbi:MAG: MBL fold metallo-hydrolase, partial [Candidatus Kerfeldbacteria bacterium]|nr:MBL fold metallo-hydrolase [Candidatus Kerfeldbacteria bacterium]
VKDGEEIHGFKVIHLPGHTMEEVGYLDTESGIFFGGDLIQFEGPPGSAYLSFMLIDSSVRCGLESVERVIAMASAGQITGFVPSHGPIEIHPERIASRLTECRRQYLDLLDEVVDYPAARIREYLNRHSSDEYFWGKSWLERRSGACALWRAANIERENCFAL